GGRGGVMEAVCKGAAAEGGLAIGLLPETDPTLGNDYASVLIATGIGEARNALIARAAFCLVAIGDSFGTLSEVALGRQFGKVVIGLEGAAHVEGVQHVTSVEAALARIAALIGA
ncbi:MAG: lysine decarboxylase, partial [Burkholderiales bacterium]